jgi:hypothetical protein
VEDGNARVIRILKVPLPKEKLQALEPSERSLLFLLGYAHNQISMLWKFVVFSTNEDSAHDVERRIAAAQTQMLVRHTLGVLQETWKLIDKRFLSSPLGRTYVPLLDAKGSTALDKLKNQMRGSDLLRTLRNDFAFHYPEQEDVELGYQAAMASGDFTDEWNWFLSDAVLNSFFFASDVVIAHGMMNAAGSNDLNNAHEKIMIELAAVQEPLSEFILAYVGAVWKKHFGTSMDIVEMPNIETAPNFEDVRLPFYTEWHVPPLT